MKLPRLFGLAGGGSVFGGRKDNDNLPGIAEALGLGFGPLMTPSDVAFATPVDAASNGAVLTAGGREDEEGIPDIGVAPIAFLSPHRQRAQG